MESKVYMLSMVQVQMGVTDVLGKLPHPRPCSKDIYRNKTQSLYFCSDLMKNVHKCKPFSCSPFIAVSNNQQFQFAITQ